MTWHERDVPSGWSVQYLLRCQVYLVEVRDDLDDPFSAGRGDLLFLELQ